MILIARTTLIDTESPGIHQLRLFTNQVHLRCSLTNQIVTSFQIRRTPGSVAMKRRDVARTEAPASKRPYVMSDKKGDKTTSGEGQASASACGACASVIVLSDPALFRVIMMFQPGLPQRLLDLERTHDITAANTHKSRAKLEYLDQFSIREDHPSMVEVLDMARNASRSLTDLAIETNDQRSLEMIYELRQQDEFRKHPRFRFYQVMRVAARFGRLGMLEWLSRLDEADKWLRDSWLLDAALQSSDLPTSEWVMENYCGADELMILTKTLDKVAAAGALDILKLIFKSFPKAELTTDAMDGAAQNGHLNVVKYIHETRPEGCTTSAMENAAMNGHLHVVKWLHDNRIGEPESQCTSSAIENAALCGRLEVLQFLYDHYKQVFTSEAISTAAMDGHLEVIRYLHETCGLPLDMGILYNGMKHLDIVRYVFDHGGPNSWNLDVMDSACSTSLEHAKLFHDHGAFGCTTGAMDKAAGEGHLDIVRFLHEHRIEGCTSAAMDNAASHGHIEVVRFLHENRKEGCTANAMDDAAAGGHFEVVRFLHENREEGCTEGAIDLAAGNGHLNIVRFLFENQSEGCTGKGIQEAAANNHLEAVKYLMEKGWPSSNVPDDVEVAAAAAAENGHLDVVKYLLESSEGSCGFETVFDKAAEVGRLQMTKYIYHSRKWEMDAVTSAVEVAVSNGHYDVIKYLLTEHGDIPEIGIDNIASTVFNHGCLEVVQVVSTMRHRCFEFGAFAVAAKRGHLELLKFLHKYFQSQQDRRLGLLEEFVIQEAINTSADNGHLEVVQWLHHHYSSQFTRETIACAAGGGHVDVLRFLLDHTALRPTNRAISESIAGNHLAVTKLLTQRYGPSFRYRQSTMDEAAVKGSFSLVQFLHRHRLEKFTTKAIDGAAAEGRIDVVRFLHVNRSEGCTTNAMDEAARSGYLDVVRFLHEHRTEGCTTEAMDHAAEFGYLDVVKFLHEHRTEGCTVEAMEYAAASGHLDIVKFLHDYRPEGCTPFAMDEAAAKGHISIVKFLHENRPEGCTVKAMDLAAENGHLRVVQFPS